MVYVTFSHDCNRHNGTCKRAFPLLTHITRLLRTLQYTNLPVTAASKFEAVAALAEGDCDSARRAIDLAQWDDCMLGTTSSGKSSRFVWLAGCCGR